MSHRRAGFLATGLLLAAVIPSGFVPTAQPWREQPAGKEARVVKRYTLPPEKYQQAVAFNRARDRLYFIGFAYGVLVYLLVLAGRLAVKYRDLAERASSRRIAQAFVCVPLLLLTLCILNLPRSAYGHWLAHKFGLSVQGWTSWAADWIKVQLLTFVVGAFLAWVLYGAMRRSPRRWWFYSWLAALPILVIVVFIEPLIIEPLFFRFEPLAPKRPQLAGEIEKVAQRGGLRIPPERIFEINASKKLNAVNAYVTGIGASKRVVVWDTTIEKLTVPQILVVFGHEMGHYRLAHIPQGMALSAGQILVFLLLGFHLLGAILRRWGPRWGIRGVDDWASLPVILLLFSVLGFLGAPVENTYSRYIEHQADMYSLEVIHGIVARSGEVAAETFQVEGEINLADPHPSAFIRIWLYSHPPLEDRLIFAQTYDPWGKGQTPHFVK
ncbi:MAG TPA: M48 family metallopeptidase [Candidatus Acidoferrales bacterium]|nr:M48 family metallopeptidase [Candidatus Acidoferrales bacterium]